MFSHDNEGHAGLHVWKVWTCAGKRIRPLPLQPPILVSKLECSWLLRAQILLARSRMSYHWGHVHVHVGFCDDYVKVIYGTKQSLQLNRQGEADAIFRTAAVPNGRITLTKLCRMPHVRPSVEYTNSLIKDIENKARVPLAFRTMQCNSLAVPRATTFSWPLSSESENRAGSFSAFKREKKAISGRIQRCLIMCRFAMSTHYWTATGIRSMTGA